MQENPGYEAEFSRKVDWGLNLREGYTSHTFSNASPWRNSEGFWKWVNPGLIRRVAKGLYDAVYAHGHNNFTHLAAIVAARLTGKRTIIRADTCNLGSRSLLKRLARRLVYTLTFRLAHVLLYVGELNRRCFEDYGGRPEQLVHAPQVVDNARFAGEWARYAIIVSDMVGCAPDLMADKCGLVFPHDSSDVLVDALKRMAGDDELRSAFAERAQAVIAQWSVPAYVSGLRRGLGLPDCGDQ